MSCSTDFNRNAMLGTSAEIYCMLVCRCTNGRGIPLFKSAALLCLLLLLRLLDMLIEYLFI